MVDRGFRPLGLFVVDGVGGHPDVASHPRRASQLALKIGAGRRSMGYSNFHEAIPSSPSKSPCALPSAAAWRPCCAADHLLTQSANTECPRPMKLKALGRAGLPTHKSGQGKSAAWIHSALAPTHSFTCATGAGMPRLPGYAVHASGRGWQGTIVSVGSARHTGHGSRIHEAQWLSHRESRYPSPSMTMNHELRHYRRRTLEPLQRTA